jgi:2,4-dienoyl-CoA reductase-like NADH-dependent reductase (Old Yellow Enzyme family)
MKLALEKSITSSLNFSAGEHYSFLRINLEKDLKDLGEISENTMPMLFFPGMESSSSLWQEAFLADVIEQHLKTARLLKSRGIDRAVIAADQDGLWARMLSPRFSDWPLEKRLKPVLELFSRLSEELGEIWVLLTIEELMPGGMDATDGVKIAQSLEQAGLTTLIAASGSKDFLPLYDRKVTKKKKSQENDFASHEPGLASALWVRHYTTLKVWALLDIDNPDCALQLAQDMGLVGIIQKS